VFIVRCRREEFVEGAIFHIYNHSVDEFNNYKERIIEYEKYLDEEQFKEILFWNGKIWVNNPQENWLKDYG